jgi:uncharacterized membrane protein
MRTPRIAPAIIMLLVGWTAGSIAPATLQAQSVRAVLFFSPTCQHCEQVMTQDLPTFFQVYGGRPQVLMNQEVPEPARFAFLVTNGQLQILMVDASRPEGGMLYQASLDSYPTEPRRLGVPRLIVGDEVLVGSVEIPSRLHGKISTGLESGGTEWPTIAGLEEVIATLTPLTVASEDAAKPDTGGEPARPGTDAEQVATDSVADSTATAPEPGAADRGEPARVEPGAAASKTETGVAPPDEAAADSVLAAIPFERIVERRLSVRQRFMQDAVGNGLSVLVLLLMVGSVIAVPRLAASGKVSRKLSIAIPLVAALGVAVAGYLTYIETTGASAVCGPVGDCNAVQQSEHAVLFGILPVGLLGLLGYLVIIAAWLVAGSARSRAAEWAAVALVATALVGTVFSIYLTFLEPFVIGATCAWCLTSAVLITLLLWLSAGAGIEAWARLRAPAASA